MAQLLSSGSTEPPNKRSEKKRRPVAPSTTGVITAAKPHVFFSKIHRAMSISTNVHTPACATRWAQLGLNKRERSTVKERRSARCASAQQLQESTSCARDCSGSHARITQSMATSRLALEERFTKEESAAGIIRAVNAPVTVEKLPMKVV